MIGTNMNECKDTLYHYTSREAFLNIIQNKTLWATNILYLNDSLEAQYTFKLFDSVINSTKNDKDKFKSFDLMVKKYVKKGDSVLDKYIDCLFANPNSNNFLKDYVFENPYFVASFSSSGDLLSQWRGYCNQSGGLSIGFSKNYISELQKNYRYMFTKCIYEKEDQLRAIKKSVNEAVSQFSDQFLDKKDFEEKIFNVIQSLLLKILLCSPIFKHESFSDEQEWRIIVGHNPVNKKDIQYRSGTSMVVPYFEIDLEPFRSDLKIELDEVIVGPTPHPELSKASIEAFLESEDIRVGRVVNSSIPYRSW